MRPRFRAECLELSYVGRFEVADVALTDRLFATAPLARMRIARCIDGDALDAYVELGLERVQVRGRLLREIGAHAGVERRGVSHPARRLRDDVDQPQWLENPAAKHAHDDRKRLSLSNRDVDSGVGRYAAFAHAKSTAVTAATLAIALPSAAFFGVSRKPSASAPRSRASPATRAQSQGARRSCAIKRPRPAPISRAPKVRMSFEWSSMPRRRQSCLGATSSVTPRAMLNQPRARAIFF